MLGDTPGEALRKLLLLPGSLYSCVADPATGRVVAETGAEGTAGASGAVLSWGAEAARFLTVAAGDDLDDVMITSRRSYHLVREVESGSSGRLLVYLCLDRARSNLAIARRELAATRLGEVAREAAPGPVTGLAPAGESISQDVPSSLPAEGAPVSGAAPVADADGQADSATTGPASAPEPLPRRELGALAPPPPSPEVLGDGTKWVNDPDTVRRLLAALRKRI